MACLLAIEIQCDVPWCQRRATVRLLDWRNEDRGKFCRRHGKEKLRAREKYEKENPHHRA